MITVKASSYIDNPRTCAVNPRPICSTSLVIIRNRPTPIAISGVMNENSITKSLVPAPRPRHRSSAMAKATPSGTAITTVSADSFRLWNSAERKVSSCHTELTSVMNQRVAENPCQVVCAFPALNE